MPATTEDMIKEIEFLKDYIWKNGFEKLSEDSFGVYKAMIKGGISVQKARLVLVTLLSETHGLARKMESTETITAYIQSEHYLNKKAARQLADMYLSLFSSKNEEDWDKAKESGFKEFCEKQWTIEWDGSCVWHTKHGITYPCSADAVLEFVVADEGRLHDHLRDELEKNPFLTADDVYGILLKQIEADLDDNLDDYCNADDYYEPYREEFTGEGTYESGKNGSPGDWI